MTEWVLVVMLCTRNCQPSQAQIFPTKKECIARIEQPEGVFTRPSHYCVPLIKEN